MNVKLLKSKMLAAFSLIELMVVIAIIAVLTAVALPSYLQYINQSKVAEIFSLASNQMSLFAQYYNAGSGFDLCNSGATICSQTNTTAANVGNYIGYTEIFGNTCSEIGTPTGCKTVGNPVTSTATANTGLQGTASVGGVIIALTTGGSSVGAGTISLNGTTLDSVVIELLPTISLTSEVSGDTSDLTLTWTCQYNPTTNTAATTLFANFPPNGCTAGGLE